NRYFSEFWLKPFRPLPAMAGHNRFVWNLRYARPKASDYDYSIAATPWADASILPQGMLAIPGKYTVRLTVEGHTISQPLEIRADPRVKINMANLKARKDLYDKVTQALAQASEKYDQAKALNDKLEASEDVNAPDVKKKHDQLAP